MAVPASRGVPAYGNFIGGGWRPARTGEVLQSCDPATGEPVARAARSGRDDLDDAVQGARRALRASGWATDPGLRARVLDRLADALESRRDALAELNTRRRRAARCVNAAQPVRAATFSGGAGRWRR